MNYDYEDMNNEDMNYEKLYNDALQRATQLYRENTYKPNEAALVKQVLTLLFPSLDEDEDEHIRKSLISYFNEQGNNASINGITGDDIVAWLERQKQPEDKGEISDGYHTFNELYYYRMLYNAAFFNTLPKDIVHKSKRHHTGEECFGGGWFIVMANLPTGQISNHYEMKYWKLFQIPERDVADEWDGHTPQLAATRLHEYINQTVMHKNVFDEMCNIASEMKTPAQSLGLSDDEYNRIENDFFDTLIGTSTQQDNKHMKFKNNDFVLFNDKIYQIKSCTPDSYFMLDITNNKYEVISHDYDNMMKPWDITLAKSGDILYSKQFNMLWIYKDASTYHAAINLNYPDMLLMNKNTTISIPTDTCPASPYQCVFMHCTLATNGYMFEDNEIKIKKHNIKIK